MKKRNKTSKRELSLLDAKLLREFRKHFGTMLDDFKKLERVSCDELILSGDWGKKPESLKSFSLFTKKNGYIFAKFKRNPYIKKTKITN